MDRIVLVKPNTKDSQYGQLKNFSAIEPPIWHAVLADYYKAKQIIDAEAEDLDVAETVHAIQAYEPDYAVILATGSHPSGFIQQQEGMMKLALACKGKVNVKTLNCLPFSPMKWTARWDLLDMNNYRCHNWHSWTNDCKSSPYGVTYTSVSCPFKCNFCTVHQFYGTQFEQRTLEAVMEDFDYFARNGIKNIKIMDELFIFNPSRVHLICDEIIKRGYDFNIWAYARVDIMDNALLAKMRKAGIRWLAYGFETGNEEIRRTVLKGKFTNQRIRDVVKMTKDNDICIIGNFMFGFWDDNESTMQETYDLAVDLNCEYINFYCLVAYPGTPFYNELAVKGVSLPKEWHQYAQTSPTFKPLDTQYMSADEVLKFRDNAFVKYLSSSSYISMMQKKFGQNVLDDIDKMLAVQLQRI